MIDIDIKKFLCLNCKARFEEAIIDEFHQEITCLNCGSYEVLPFAESAIGQDGCDNEHCNRRVGGDCGGCEKQCGHC